MEWTIDFIIMMIWAMLFFFGAGIAWGKKDKTSAVVFILIGLCAYIVL